MEPTQVSPNPRPWRQGAWGGLLIALVGLVLWRMHLADPLTFLSYDLPVAFQPTGQPQDVIILYLDEQTFKDLGQSPQNFSRTNHAHVLHHLTEDGARLVVYDIWLSDPRTPEENAALAEAMRGHGGVVIAHIAESSSSPYLSGSNPRPPLPQFIEASAGTGLSQVFNAKSVVRRYDPGTEDQPALPWMAARVAGLALPDRLLDDPYNNWINYQCPPGRLRSLSFSQALTQPPEKFRDKYVFIGARSKTPEPFDEVEEFRVPHSRFGWSVSPGVDIWAHAFLNLKNGDWWSRWPPAAECSFLLLMGAALGFGFARLTFRQAFATGVVLGFLLLAAGFYSAWQWHQWFCWSLAVIVQIPVACGWAFWTKLKTMSHEKNILEEQLVTTLETAERLRGEAESRQRKTSSDRPAQPRLTDHTLIRRIGRGAYGEVWLARNAVGIHHAVKIIHRDAFDKQEPYEREFRGIEKFMPVSRQHPGLVHVLHVGRNDDEGWFYYVMEAADDAEGVSPIDPSAYAPKSLTTVLRKTNALPAREAARLMIQLAEALGHLHENKLIHRDIKPANIIFVRDQAKLADIGLVTDIAATGEDVTCVGTAGYMAPEGPGTPAADIYSLGKVIYEACFGMDPDLFPELPTGTNRRDDYPLLVELNKIIGRVCHHDPARRYRSASVLADDLRKIAGGGKV